MERANILAIASTSLGRGFSKLGFIRFAILPALVLFLMNMVWGDSIENIGCVAQGKARIDLLYLESPSAPAACLANRSADVERARLVEAREKAIAELRKIDPKKAAAVRRPAVAIGEGRFQWMTFHLLGLILLPAVAAASFYVMRRNLGPGSFAATASVTLAVGIGWAISSVGRPETLAYDTASLLLPTKIHALSQFDADFAASAWRSVLWDYGATLAVTVLVVVAASTVLSGVGRKSVLDRPSLDSKRRDLKLIIFAASMLMTFTALYVGEWLAWPARFAPAADSAGSFRGSAEEFRAVASGLRLYFGTGYTLALIAFAVPAVLALPREIATAAGPGAAASPAGEDGDLISQSVFSKAELGMLLSVLTPFVSTLIGAAFQI